MLFLPRLHRCVYTYKEKGCEDHANISTEVRSQIEQTLIRPVYGKISEYCLMELPTRDVDIE